jgi:hypothetical protein
MGIRLYTYTYLSGMKADLAARASLEPGRLSRPRRFIDTV